MRLGRGCVWLRGACERGCEVGYIKQWQHGGAHDQSCKGAIGGRRTHAARRTCPRLRTYEDDVADKSASVNSKLQRRRQHCEELRRVGDVLTKLQVRSAP